MNLHQLSVQNVALKKLFRALRFRMLSKLEPHVGNYLQVEALC